MCQSYEFGILHIGIDTGVQLSPSDASLTTRNHRDPDRAASVVELGLHGKMPILLRRNSGA
jgi:hypothetical protein